MCSKMLIIHFVWYARYTCATTFQSKALQATQLYTLHYSSPSIFPETVSDQACDTANMSQWRVSLVTRVASSRPSSAARLCGTGKRIRSLDKTAARLQSTDPSIIAMGIIAFFFQNEALIPYYLKPVHSGQQTIKRRQWTKFVH